MKFKFKISFKANPFSTHDAFPIKRIVLLWTYRL